MLDFRKIEAKALRRKKASEQRRADDKAYIESFKARKKKDNQRKRLEREARAEQIDGVKYSIVDGVKTVMILDWVQSNLMDDSEQKLYKWCQKNNAHYYSRVKEKFSMTEAIEEMKNFKREVLVIEEK